MSNLATRCRDFVTAFGPSQMLLRHASARQSGRCSTARRYNSSTVQQRVYRPFPFPHALPSWYQGHMHRAKKLMEAKMSAVDLFVEVRDARLPLSTINPIFSDPAFKGIGRRKLIIYNRRDLGDARFEPLLKNAFEMVEGDQVIFANSRSDHDARAVLRKIIQMTKGDRLLPPVGSLTTAGVGDGPRIMIGGMPNVGKSSLLNALRRVGLHKRKAATVGADPGVTRKLMGVVKIWENPNIYVYDTPGMMMPFLGRGESASERALKIALSGGIKHRLFSLETLGEYLLWRINYRFFDSVTGEPLEELPEGIKRLTPPLPTLEFEPFVKGLARRLGALLPGGIADEGRAIKWLIDAFREGKLGSWSLDDLTFTGPFYARLDSGQTLFTPALPSPKSAPLSNQRALQLGQEMRDSLVPSNPTMTLDALAIPQDMPLAERVNLAVDFYVNLERHRHRYPRPETMSKNAVRNAEKSAMKVERQKKMQRLGIVGRSRHLGNTAWKTKLRGFRMFQKARKRQRSKR